MANPRNLLILLGFVCQGFSWADNYLMPAAFALLWALCLRSKAQKRPYPSLLETALFSAGCGLSFAFAGHSYFERILAIGNGLLILQTLRLTYPLNQREKFLSLAMAATQLAIGSQVMVDYDFIVVLAATIVLLPKALHDLRLEAFDEPAVPFPFRGRLREYAWIVVVMAAFFVLTPRHRLVGGSLLGGGAGPMRPSLETAGRSREAPDKVLFKIYGEDIGHLKSYALDSFDGNNWTASEASYSAGRKFTRQGLDKAKHRLVELRDPRPLGRSLPTDGFVKELGGNFFQNPYISEQGSVLAPLFWPRGNNNSYEYWTSSEPDLWMPITAQRNCLAYPKQPERLVRWLDKLVGPERDPGRVALKLESHLKNNFTYELGEPLLDRLNPVDDFVFNQKKGHCERFAATLALLLRMKGVPSRVVVGYMPGEKNQFADFHNIRVRNGHAWTEAYLPKKGWTTLDATPYQESHPNQAGDFALSVLDWIDYVWYSKIVSFSSQDQKSLLELSADLAQQASEAVSNAWAQPLAAALALLAALAILRRRLSFAALRSALRRRAERKAAEEAAGFYAETLAALAKHGFARRPSQTPLEFLAQLEAAQLPCLAAARTVTELFCDTKYGGIPLSQERRRHVHEAIKTIKNIQYPTRNIQR